MVEVTYKMGVFANTLFKYDWAIRENPILADGMQKDDALVKAFAKQQDQYSTPDELWYIQCWFKRNDDPVNDNEGHVFPSAIPLTCILGKKNGDIIEFELGNDPDSGEELLVRVECDQSIVPGFNPNKWSDEDVAYCYDPFVAEYTHAIFQRLERPYKINYGEVEKERVERDRQVTERLEKMFSGVSVKKEKQTDDIDELQ